MMDIDRIRPSQLYISREKLARVERHLARVGVEEVGPLPIKRIGTELFFTDGHTRGLALMRKGVNRVKVSWETEELDWQAYLICLGWCRDVGVLRISDLEDRVITSAEYNKLWYERYNQLKERLTKQAYEGLRIRHLTIEEEKSLACQTVLEELIPWFELEEARKDYIAGVRDTNLWVAEIAGTLVGLIALKHHNPSTSEIYVMGVLPEFHSQGIGRLLLDASEDWLKRKNRRFLTVKTLGPSNPDPYYKKTRAFYHSVGFTPLEEFKTLWDETNPCLFLVKSLT